MTSRLSYGMMVLALAGAISGAAAQVGGSGQSQATNPAIQLDAVAASRDRHRGS